MNGISNYPNFQGSWLRPHLQRTVVSVFIFIAFVSLTLTNVPSCAGSSRFSTPIFNSFSPRQPRQTRFGGFTGALGSFFQPQPYSQRQQTDVNFLNSMMSMNFDMTEILAMYRNVTAVAVTPGCFGQCRTPMALYMIQSFYPCYNLQKVDCPKGLVCCMQDTSTRIASANTIHDSRVKATAPISSDETGEDDRYNVPLPQRHMMTPSVAVAASSQSTTKAKPDGTTATHTSSNNGPLFNEEYYKNNFIQDEIPE